MIQPEELDSILDDMHNLSDRLSFMEEALFRCRLKALRDAQSICFGVDRAKIPELIDELNHVE